MRRLIAVGLIVAGGTALAQSPAMRERMTGTIRALNGTAEEYETYAKDTFVKALFDKETPEQRRKLFDSIRADYGTLTPGRAAREDPMRVRLTVTGAKGKTGDLILEHEVELPHRITSLAIEASGGGPPAAATRARLSDADVAQIADGFVAPLAQAGTFSGTLLVARAGIPVFRKGYGFANRETGEANTPDTRFNVGSINKQFTRAALALLATAGKLSLDDPVEKHLRDYPNPAGRKTTIRQLVTHQGGLPEWRNDPDFEHRPKSEFRVNRDFYRIVASKPLRFTPGTKTEYCNACFVVLGEIIERVAGMPYERYTEENVLRSASMTSSGFFHIDKPQPRMAIGYTRTPQGLVANFAVRGAGGNAAGGAFVTPGNLLAFEQAVRGGRILNSQWTAWFLDNRTRVFFGGGGEGVSAALLGDGEWTVVAIANLDTPAGSSVAKALFSKISQSLE